MHDNQDGHPTTAYLILEMKMTKDRDGPRLTGQRRKLRSGPGHEQAHARGLCILQIWIIILIVHRHACVEPVVDKLEIPYCFPWPVLLLSSGALNTLRVRPRGK